MQKTRNLTETPEKKIHNITKKDKTNSTNRYLNNPRAKAPII